MSTRVLVIAALVGLVVVGLIVAVYRPAQRAVPVAVPVQEIEVTMSEFRFEPETIEVRAGKVRFRLKNTGLVEHDFVIPQLGLRSPVVAPGQEKEWEVEIKAQPGEYRIDCDIPGHREAGMIGTLVVNP